MTIGAPKLTTKGTLYLKEHSILTASSQRRRPNVKAVGESPGKESDDPDELLLATQAVTLMKQRTVDAYNSKGNPITPGNQVPRLKLKQPKRLQSQQNQIEE